MSRTRRHAIRAGGGVVAALVLCVLAASPAFAHVEASETSYDAGGPTTVAFEFTHGCKESPTKALRVQLPTGATDAKATKTPDGWTATVSSTEVDWTGGTPFEATDDAHSFEVSVKLDGAKGDTVFFPTIQTCVDGENSWIDKSSDPEAESAAPRIVLGTTVASDSSTTAPSDHDHDNAGTTEAPASTTTAPKATSTTGASTTTTKATAGTAPGTTVAPATTSSSSSNLPLILGIVAVIVIAGVIAALVLRGRSASGGPSGSSPAA